MNWTVVVPSNRPNRLAAFKQAWNPIFARHEATLLVVEDAPEPSDPSHYSWKDLPSWFPRQTDMIRSYGFWQAWVQGADYVLSLDDDVLPGPLLLTSYNEHFGYEFAEQPCSTYLDLGALCSNPPLRGFPYRNRESDVALQIGGIDGMPDLDARTQLRYPDSQANFPRLTLQVPRGCAVTVSSMNLAFKAEYAPIMWQLPVLDQKFKRFGDIWAGLLAKRVLDALGKVVLVNGYATVQHDRASDPEKNLILEQPGMEPNEDLWEALCEPDRDKGMLGMYRQVTDSLAVFMEGRGEHAYADHFTSCRDSWLRLFR